MAEAGGDDQGELKKKLVRRIGIAGVLIVVLLGGLALLEDFLLERPSPPAAPVLATAPPAAEPPKAEASPAEEKKDEAKPEESQPAAEPEKSEMPLAPAPAARPAARVIIRPPAAAPAKKPEPPAPAAPPPAAKAEPAADVPQGDFLRGVARSYRLQMGVFTSAANAGELHAKLEKAGIPSYVESRVHVGPFRTQQEAEAARRKLKELGLGPGLLIPPQKR